MALMITDQCINCDVCEPACPNQAIAPGVDFDTARGGSFVRLSFAGPAADIAEALRRLERWLPGQAAKT
jgi:ferredoxin